MSSENRVGVYINRVRKSADRKFGRTPFELRLDGAYTDVVYRLGKVLPIDVMFDWFSSTPGRTGGRAVFPYQRIDSNLSIIRNSLTFLGQRINEKENYEQATRLTARTLSWIEIGWGSIENFASNPDATSNWTSGPDHFADGEERARYIVGKGKDWLDEVIRKYLIARYKYGPKYGGSDVFRRYKIEYLLSR